jgi:hypothetical protein
MQCSPAAWEMRMIMNLHLRIPGRFQALYFQFNTVSHPEDIRQMTKADIILVDLAGDYRISGRVLVIGRIRFGFIRIYSTMRGLQIANPVSAPPGATSLNLTIQLVSSVSMEA